MRYSKDRDLNLYQSSFIPGSNKSFPVEYHTDAVRNEIPSGYEDNEQMHHLVPAELFGAFVQNLNREEAEIVIDRANQLGIRVGNDPSNFAGLDKMKEHIRNYEYSNTVHSKLDEIGLESSELEGEDRKKFYNLLNKIASSSLKQRLAALPDFVTYIAEPAIEIGRQFRPEAQGILENKKQYAADKVIKELRSVREADILDGLEGTGLPRKLPSGNDQRKKGGKELSLLLKDIKDMDYSPKRTIARSAGDKFTGMIRVNSPGDTINSPITTVTSLGM